MTHKENIEYHKNQFNKVVSSHGADSEYAVNAFFVLQGAKMGMPVSDLFKWAISETEKLHQTTLDQLQ